MRHSMTPGDMADHVELICAEHGIEIGSHSSGGRAWKKAKHIDIRPVKSAITYAIALHEIGHILGQWQSKPRLVKEAGAWLWALENTTDWTPVMDKTMNKALGSYLEWAKAKQHRKHPPIIPEEGHEFWNMIGAE